MEFRVNAARDEYCSGEGKKPIRGTFDFMTQTGKCPDCNGYKAVCRDDEDVVMDLHSIVVIGGDEDEEECDDQEGTGASSEAHVHTAGG